MGPFSDPQDTHLGISYWSDPPPLLPIMFFGCYCECQFVWGPLMGGPQCRLSILRNGNVPFGYFKHFPVDFNIV